MPDVAQSVSPAVEVDDVLCDIRRAYRDDPKFRDRRFTDSLLKVNDLLYLKDHRLVIPDNIRIRDALIYE